jgi:hypothetical protein
MFFANEDILAVHTVSRAAFRILYDITKEGEAKIALDAHIKKSASTVSTKKLIF